MEDARKKYDDIIDLPHYQSDKRPKMSNYDRAAQFSPFAALTGHEDVIKETARITREYVELSEDEKAVLNEKLLLVIESIDKQPEITVTYFKPDEKKSGGEYIVVTGIVKKYREYERTIEFTDGKRIEINSIFSIEGELFRQI